MGNLVAHLARIESRLSPRVVAGIVTAALHLGLFLVVVYSGGRFDGVNDSPTPITQLVLVESPRAESRDGTQSPPWEVTPPELDAPESVDPDVGPPPTLLVQETLTVRTDVELPPVRLDPVDRTQVIVPPVIDSPSTLVMPAAQTSSLVQRLTKLAQDLIRSPQTHVAWEEDGRQYRAKLVMQRASDGLEFDRVIAEVSAEDSGKQLTTQVKLKRLAFSHYTQMIDRWDPQVRLHDDQIVGRFHVNSRFNVTSTRRTAPQFLGKVTTAAASFNSQAGGGRRDHEIFRGGLETRVDRIDLPEEAQPFVWAPRGENARVHEFVDDTHLEFFGDGSYTSRLRGEKSLARHEGAGDELVYFVGSRGTTLYVKGVVAGKLLVYSPHRIVIEGDITYARDPRVDSSSRDYLGLVSERNIEIAPRYVTGPGDLEIHGALYAGRRFVVTEIEQEGLRVRRHRSGTLKMYGSLAAGSVSATEPRYATKIEYDERFEKQRPPGFPSTDRFALEDWDERWSQSP